MKNTHKIQHNVKLYTTFPKLNYSHRKQLKLLVLTNRLADIHFIGGKLVFTLLALHKNSPKKGYFCAEMLFIVQKP